MSSAIKKAWRQVRWSLAQRGVWGTVRVMARRAARGRKKAADMLHPFDVEYGVDTSGLIGGGELAAGGANDRYATAYHGVPPARMRDALERWRATSGTRSLEEYAFVDIGCGKGRAVMLASELPFCEVMGVELNAELARIAEANLARWGELGRDRCPVRILQGDATEIELPPAPLLIYMYNPFHAPVMRKLLERIDAIAVESRGLIDVLYLVPQQEAVFQEFAKFSRLWSERSGTVDEDNAGDSVVSEADRCNLYRR